MLNEDYKELLWCRESDIAEDCNLFEKALWNANKVCVVPGRPMYFEDEPAETLPDVQEYRLRMMEDMVEYYQCHQVNDDDLDTIQQVMQGGYEQLTQNSFLVPDRAVCGEDCYFRDKVPCELCHAYFAAVDVLDCHHVVFDETTGAVTKSLEEIGDACLRYDIGRRTWCQIGVGSSEYEYIADSVEDNQAGPGEVCEERLLKERLREVLNTLTDRERQTIDFRFGLSDGYSRKLEEVGRLFNVTRERIREVVARALRKLRHPIRMRAFIEAVEKQVLLEHGSDKFSMEDLKEVTHLSEHEIRRRLRERWPAERVLTERIRPTKTVLVCVVSIGDVRFEICTWMEVLGINVEDLCQYVNWDKLNTVWSKDIVWEAVLKCLAERLHKENRDYDEYLSLLGAGWSREQIDGGRCQEVPLHYKSLIIHIENVCARLSVWQRKCNSQSTSQTIAPHLRDISRS